MAEGNYREYLKGDIVKAKKYFYVVRPLLACHWILEKGTPPPMLFDELVEASYIVICRRGRAYAYARPLPAPRFVVRVSGS
jgi:hypothetical protein